MAFAPRNNVNCDNRAHPSRSTNNWRFETRAEAPASLPARQNPSTSPPKIKTELSTNSPSSESIIQTHNHDHRERKIMPKDFLQPMTCFYWATQGRCTKTADECFYAHWDTGVIASAPVSMARDGQSVTVAGRHADAQIADFIARENSLKTRELALNSRQMLLNQHEAALNARCANMKTAMQEVYDTIETFDHESAEALRALHRRKKQIEEFNVATATEGQPSEYGALLLFAVNGSIGAVTKMALRVDEVGNYMKEHIGINAVHEASVAAFVQANSHV